MEATRGQVRQVPVLALNGQYGHPGVAEPFEGIAATVVGATTPACGHLLAQEQPDAVVAQILAFAGRHGQRLPVA